MSGSRAPEPVVGARESFRARDVIKFRSSGDEVPSRLSRFTLENIPG